MAFTMQASTIAAQWLEDNDTDDDKFFVKNKQWLDSLRLHIVISKQQEKTIFFFYIPPMTIDLSYV